jgi:hypothetical protein
MSVRYIMVKFEYLLFKIMELLRLIMPSQRPDQSIENKKRIFLKTRFFIQIENMSILHPYNFHCFT